MPTSGVFRVADFEQMVQGKIPDFLRDYYATGAGDEQTLQDSIEAFKRFRLKPRVLRSTDSTDVKSKVLGQDVSIPLGIAPVALQRAAHPLGELATAKAAEAAGAIMIVSCWSMYTYEDVAAAATSATLWAQLYPFKDRCNTVDIIRRAERAGYRALVVTVDSPVVGIFARSVRSIRDVQEQFKRLTPGLVNYQGAKDEIQKWKNSGDDLLWAYARDQTETATSWNDIKWIQSRTKLPVILKGILTAEDAREAATIGVQGVIVSAHGGRQLDGVQAPIEALPEVVDALKGTNLEVYLDGGVRSGGDIFKALAIGAKCVFIGRPVLWGLLHNLMWLPTCIMVVRIPFTRKYKGKGEDGVKEILQMLKREFTITMSLCGCNKLSEITRSFVRHQSQLTCKL